MSERRHIVPSGFETQVRHEGSSLDVALAGELDMASTFKLEAELERLWAEHEVHRLVLDLGDLTFVDSAGLGALIAIREQTRDRGIEMTVTNPSHPVRRVIELSGTGDVLLD